MHEEDKYVEEFLIGEGEQGEMESFNEIICDIHLLFSYFWK